MWSGVYCRLRAFLFLASCLDSSYFECGQGKNTLPAIIYTKGTKDTADSKVRVEAAGVTSKSIWQKTKDSRKVLQFGNPGFRVLERELSW